MSTQMERLQKLAELDDRLKAIDEERQEGPRRIAEAEARVADLRAREIEAAATAKHARVEANRMDLDVRTVEEKIEKLRGQQAGAKSNKEYDVFRQEILALKTQISELETKALEAMESADKQEAEAKRLVAEASSAKGPLEAVKREVAETDKRLAAEAETLRAQRGEARQGIHSDVLAEYERALKKHGKRALSCGDGNICRICGLRITIQDIQSIKLAAADAVVKCRSCGRLLYLEEDLPLRTDTVIAGES